MLALLAPLAVRRRYPLTVMVACGLIFFVSGLRSPVVTATFSHQVGLFVAIYTAGAWARDRRRLLWLRSGLLVVMFAWIVQLVLTTEETPVGGPGALDPLVAAAVLTLAVNVLYFGGAWWTGDLEWHAARRRAVLREQADRLRAAGRRDRSPRRHRRAAADRARAARRRRPPRLRDGGAGGRRAPRPRPRPRRGPRRRSAWWSRPAAGGDRDAPAPRRAADRVGGRRRHRPEHRRGTGPRSLASTRSTTSSATPPPRACDVDLHRVGDLPHVPAVLGSSAYRCVQEALANVRRHSPRRRRGSWCATSTGRSRPSRSR